MTEKEVDPIERKMERILCPGRWLGYQDVPAFVDALEQVHTSIDKLIGRGSAERASRLCRSLVSACYEKADEIDDSDGYFGNFVQSVFCSWIQALQQGGADPSLVVDRILEWAEKDDYGFCHKLEADAVKVLDAAGLAVLEQSMLRKLDESTANDYMTRYSTDVLKRIYAQRREHQTYIELCQRTGLEVDDCAAISEILQKKRCLTDALVWVEKGLALARTQDGQWPLTGHYRKKGFMPGFERVVSGTRRHTSISFLEKAKRRRRWL